MIIPKQHYKQLQGKNKKLNSVMIKKDLILSYILQEIAAENKELIFKGGTCLCKCYLNYHRLSEDLDFSLNIGNLSKKERRNYIKQNILPLLTKITNKYSLDFDSKEFDGVGTRYCPVKQNNKLFKFLIYSNKEDENPVKIEISIDEILVTKPKVIEIKNILDSKYIIFPLLKTSILAYSLEEIIYEKVRAILTRERIQERDIFDLYEINKLLKIKAIDKGGFFIKLKYFSGESFLERLKELEEFKLFDEIENMILVEIDKKEYFIFFEELKKLITEIVIN